MDFNCISIEQFRRNTSAHTLCYREDLLLSNHVEQLELFREPCRLDAAVLLVCLKGETDCTINLRPYHICSHHIAVALAGDIVQIHQVETLEAYAILLSSTYLDDLQIDFRRRSNFYLQMHQQNVFALPADEILQLQPYYTLLKSQIEHPRTESTLVIRGLIQAFSYSVISLIQAFGSSQEPTVSQPRNQQLFHKFMALLKANHASERSTKFYAERLCLTPNYLSGAIKEYSGKSMSEWINEYVVTEAKILLKNTNLSIQEIAYQLHFENQSAFGKYFKLQSGMGPKQYRSAKS